MKIIQCNICKNKNKSPLTFLNLNFIHNQHPKSFYTILTLITTALYHNVVYKKRKFFEIRIQPLSYATQLTSFVSCVNGSKLGSFFNNYLVLFYLYLYIHLFFFFATRLFLILPIRRRKIYNRSQLEISVTVSATLIPVIGNEITIR